MTLSERHLLELHDGSGIPLELIAERGYRTVTRPAELVACGFADYQARYVPGYVVPLHDTEGGNSRFAYKADCPRTDKNGKPCKYDFPEGATSILDVPKRCLAALTDPAIPLNFTEGAKKADAAAAAGYCMVDVHGVFNWARRDKSNRVALVLEEYPDWAPILPTLDGRVCRLIFDSDAFRNPHVGLAMRRLANFLARRGALVYIVHLPDEPDGSKNGLDDFIVRHSAEAFADLVDDAEPWGSIGMVRHLQARVRELEQQLSAQAAVLRNAELSATQKCVAFAVANETSWASSAGKSTPYKVNYSRLAQAAGVSTQSVSSAIKVLSEPSGLFVQHHTREQNDEGFWRSIVRLTPRHEGGVVDLLKATAVYIPPDRPAWGGKRTPRCPDHPTADVVQRRSFACAECGQVVGERIVTILKCQDDNSDELGEDNSVAKVLNDQLDISDLAPPPIPGKESGGSLPRTTGGQVDNSERCTECGRPLYPGAIARGVCDPCARALVAVAS